MKTQTSSIDYVLKHKFGYGGNKERKKLNMLKLRNIDDLSFYVDDVVLNAFNAIYSNNIIQFKTDNSKCKIVIERI